MRQHQFEKNDEKPDMRAIKAKAKARFGNLAGVQGFGVGDYVLRIYVSSKVALSSVVPARFQGVPVDVVVVGDISAQPR